MLSLDEFREPFEHLYRHISKLLIPESSKADLLACITELRRNAEEVAAYDEISLALNRRGEYWYVPESSIKAIAKIDLYDVKQANKSYGTAAVDQDIRRLGAELRQIFKISEGDYVRRASGSDEFKIMSVNKDQGALIDSLYNLYIADKVRALIPWDFGVGATESDADNNLQLRRQKIRPGIVRTAPFNSAHEHPSPRISFSQNAHVRHLKEHCARLENMIAKCGLSDDQASSMLLLAHELKQHVEREVTIDALTGVGNSLSLRWYLAERQGNPLAVAVTDIVDMHEGNIRFGTQAVDKDLSRLASVLLSEFRAEEGFKIFRPEKTGDEFIILSYVNPPEQLWKRMERLQRQDLTRSLLTWQYGVGVTEASARFNLEHLSANPVSRPKTPILVSRGTRHPARSANIYLIARPTGKDYQLIHNAARDIGKICGGAPIHDLHCTLHTFTYPDDIENCCGALAKYFSQLPPIVINLLRPYRVEVNNKPGRIWFKVEITKELEQIHHDLGLILEGFGLESVYSAEQWKPHLTAVTIKSNEPPLNENSLWEHYQNLQFKTSILELTRRKGLSGWETFAYFNLHK